MQRSPILSCIVQYVTWLVAWKTPEISMTYIAVRSKNVIVRYLTLQLSWKTRDNEFDVQRSPIQSLIVRYFTLQTSWKSSNNISKTYNAVQSKALLFDI